MLCDETTHIDCPHSQQNAVPTKVWFVSGKAANRAFREGGIQSLYRENATLSEDNKENIPPTDDKKADPQHNESKEAR